MGTIAVSLYREVDVIKVVCEECRGSYLTVSIEESYTSLCPHCGCDDVHEVELHTTFELVPTGDLIDQRFMTSEGPVGDPEFCERCGNMTEDCECGDIDFEEEYREKQERIAKEKEAAEEEEETESESTDEGGEEKKDRKGSSRNPSEVGDEDEDVDEYVSPPTRRPKWSIK